MSRLRFTALLVLVAGLTGVLVYGQDVHAKVTISENATCVNQTAQPSPDLPPGRNAVSVEMAGFKKPVRHGVVAVAGPHHAADLIQAKFDLLDELGVILYVRG
jgi:hypothetical protein